jgi:hypothetical protein
VIYRERKKERKKESLFANPKLALTEKLSVKEGVER